MRKILRTIVKQQGVTLIEIVIYIGVLSVVAVGIISIISQLITLKHNSDSYGIITSEVSNVFEKFLYDTREADNFTVVDNHTLRITKDALTTEYRLESDAIVFIDGGNSYAMTTNMVIVEDVTFSDWTSINSDNLLHIELILKRGSISETFQTSIHVR